MSIRHTFEHFSHWRWERVIGLALALNSILAVASAAEPIRTWTDASGQYRIEAKFLSRGNGEVELQKQDRTKLRVPLDKLSTADRDYVAAIELPSRMSPEVLELCQRLSQNYLHNGKFIEHKVKQPRIVQLANSSDAGVARVARWTLEDLMVMKLQSGTAQGFTEYIHLFDQQVAGVVVAQSFHDFLTELGGRQVNSLDSTKSMFQALNQSVNTGVEIYNASLILEKRSLNLMRYQQTGMRELLARNAAPAPSAESQPLAARPKLEAPYALVSLANRSKDAWHNCVVITYTDCKYVPDYDQEMSQAIVGGLVELLMDVDITPSKRQDELRRELRDIDRCMYVFIPVWKPNETIELPLGGFGTMLYAAQSTNVSLWCDEVSVVDQPIPLAVVQRQIQAEVQKQRATIKRQNMRRRPNR